MFGDIQFSKLMSKGAFALLCVYMASLSLCYVSPLLMQIHSLSLYAFVGVAALNVFLRGRVILTGYLKMYAIFAVIAANAVAVTISFHWWFAAPLAIIVTGVAIGVVESLRARNKLSRNITYILTIVAMAALVLLTGFLLIQNIEI